MHQEGGGPKNSAAARDHMTPELSSLQRLSIKSRTDFKFLTYESLRGASSIITGAAASSRSSHRTLLLEGWFTAGSRTFSRKTVGWRSQLPVQVGEDDSLST